MLHSEELPSASKHGDDSFRYDYLSGNRQLPLTQHQIQGDEESGTLSNSNRSHFRWLNDHTYQPSSFEDYCRPQVNNDDGRSFPVTTLADPLPPLLNTPATSSHFPKQDLSPIDVLQPNLTLCTRFSMPPRPRFPIPSGEFGQICLPTIASSGRDCRYPVLQPLLPYISTIIPTREACDLLDLYFTEPSTSLFECASPYVLTQIFRKKSFLCQNAPRPTSPALLAAMLWVTAQTSDAQIFKADTRARPWICDQLNRICISLLSPEDQEKQAWRPSMYKEVFCAMSLGRNYAYLF